MTKKDKQALGDFSAQKFITGMGKVWEYLTPAERTRIKGRLLKLQKSIKAERAAKARKKAPAPPPPGDVTLTAEEARKWPTLSRASRWQLGQVKKGLCAICGDEPLVSSRLGAQCLAKQRERMRKKTGAKRRNSALSYSLETRR